MISLDSTAALSAALKKLPPMAPGLTPASVYTHILLEQITADKLAVIFYGQESLYCRFLIESSSTVLGIKYLVPYTDFKEVIKKISKVYSINISSDSAGIIIETFAEMVEDKPVILDRLTLPSFYGNMDEFEVPVFTQDLSPEEYSLLGFEEFSVLAEDLVHSVSEISSYGSYSLATVSDAILLQAENGHLYSYGKQQGDPNFFLRTKVDISMSSISFTKVISSWHFQRLKILEENAANSVCFAFDSSYLYAFSEDNTLRIPFLNIDSFSYLKAMPSYFVSHTEDIKQILWHISSKRLAEALDSQQPNKNYDNKHVILTDNVSALALGKQADLKKRDYSFIEILKREEFSAEAINPLVVQVSSTALIKCCEIARYMISQNKILTDEISILLRYREVKGIKRWIVEILVPTETRVGVNMVGAVRI